MDIWLPLAGCPVKVMGKNNFEKGKTALRPQITQRQSWAVSGSIYTSENRRISPRKLFLPKSNEKSHTDKGGPWDLFAGRYQDRRRKEGGKNAFFPE